MLASSCMAVRNMRTRRDEGIPPYVAGRTMCAPTGSTGSNAFSNALNPYKRYLIHQQGGREVFPVALFYCSRFIAFFEP